MHFKVIAFTALLAASISSPIQATPITYGCDTPADSFSAIEQKVQTKSFLIKGNIQPIQFRKGKYAPLAQVYLVSADGQNRFAMKVIAEYKSKSAIVALDITRNGKDDEPFPIGTVNLSEKLNFQISVTDESKINFTIGGLEGSPEVSLGDQANLNIICSTGEFIFSDLEWNNE